MFRRKSNRLLTFCSVMCLVLGLLLLSGPVWAEDEKQKTTQEESSAPAPAEDQAAQDDGSATVMDDMVVTATRRESELRNQPSSITVVTAKEIAASPT